MRTVYIADDGKEFDNEFDCEHYEWILNHPNLKYIKIYDLQDVSKIIREYYNRDLADELDKLIPEHTDEEYEGLKEELWDKENLIPESTVKSVIDDIESDVNEIVEMLESIKGLSEIEEIKEKVDELSYKLY